MLPFLGMFVSVVDHLDRTQRGKHTMVTRQVDNEKEAAVIREAANLLASNGWCRVSGPGLA